MVLPLRVEPLQNDVNTHLTKQSWPRCSLGDPVQVLFGRAVPSYSRYVGTDLIPVRQSHKTLPVQHVAWPL